jgi:hypothetical protein
MTHGSVHDFVSWKAYILIVPALTLFVTNDRIPHLLEAHNLDAHENRTLQDLSSQGHRTLPSHHHAVCTG